jgi:glycine cleavage system H protein
MSYMSEPLIFSMGKYEAILERDRLYCRNHMWCQPQADGSHRFGFTAYAIRLMKDVYFLEWQVDVGSVVQLKQQIGNIESSKAQSDLFSPIAGEIMQINQEVLKDPSAINVDGYGAGWLFSIRGDASAQMTVEEYFQFLHTNWEQTQRILKGQMGD